MATTFPFTAISAPGWSTVTRMVPSVVSTLKVMPENHQEKAARRVATAMKMGVLERGWVAVLASGRFALVAALAGEGVGVGSRWRFGPLSDPPPRSLRSLGRELR
jgi:hypothetical protein